VRRKTRKRIRKKKRKKGLSQLTSEKRKTSTQVRWESG
jgi:hypothetical protein